MLSKTAALEKKPQFVYPKEMEFSFAHAYFWFFSFFRTFAGKAADCRALKM